MPLPSRDDLFTLYKIAIDEYRFEVKLNWDRTAYQLTLNSGLIAIATGLLKIGSAPFVDLLVALVFFIGFCTAIIGISAIRKGHDHYRRTIVKKTLIEDCLGLTKGLEGYPSGTTLAIGTTIGQGDHVEILHSPERYLNRPLRRRSISFWVRMILIFFCISNIAGIVGSLWLYAHPPMTPVNPSPFRIVPVARAQLALSGSAACHPCIESASEKIGRYSEISTNPMNRPMQIMIAGSISVSDAVTRVDTSSS